MAKLGGQRRITPPDYYLSRAHRIARTRNARQPGAPLKRTGFLRPTYGHSGTPGSPGDSMARVSPVSIAGSDVPALQLASSIPPTSRLSPAHHLVV